MAKPRIDRAIPEWVRRLGVAVWVTNIQHRVVFMNARAAALLGVSAVAVTGQPCHQVVRGTTPDGRPFCSAHCAFAEHAAAGQDLGSLSLHLTPTPESEHWVRVVPIPVFRSRGDSPLLVHCAVVEDRAHRLESYLRRLATRSDGNSEAASVPRGLTRRERDVLAGLAQDKSLPVLAEELHVSYATVRNHVQHILAKMKAHSIEEAVARHLLAVGSAPRRSTPRRDRPPARAGRRGGRPPPPA